MYSSRTFPVLAVLAIVTLACVATPSVSSPVPLSTATPVPTQAPTDTPTPIPPTATNTPLPTATPTPAPVVKSTPATPAGPPGSALLHLGWVWPEGKLKAQDRFAIDDKGTVYINDQNGRLHALLPPGKELWAFEEGEEGMIPPVLGPDGRTLYILSLMPDTLWAVGTDGVKGWDADVKHEPIALPIVAPDSAVYIRTMGGGYRYPPNGKEPAEFEWSDYFGPDSAAFDPQGRLYTRDWTEVWVHSPDGKKVRTCPIENLSGSLAGHSAGGFVYTTSEGDLVAASPECQELWRYVGGKLERRGAWQPIAVSPDGSVFAARENGEIVALDPGGKLRWKYKADEQFGEPLHLLPAPGGTLYAVSGSGQVSAFDAQGRPVWMHQLPAAGRPGPPHLTPDGGLALVQGGQLWYFTITLGMTAAEPTPVPLPASRAAAEEEIISFVLNGLGCKIESIFVLAPAADGMTGTDTQNPIRVWWCSGGKLTERKDMQAAIAEAKKRNDEADPTAESYPVADFKFTVDVDASLQRAQVYVGWMRGWLWGEGNVYILKRSATGEWWVVDSEQVWIS